MGILNFHSLNLATVMVTQTPSVRMQWWALVDRAPDPPHMPSNRERLLLIKWHINMSMWEVHEELSRRGACVLTHVCMHPHVGTCILGWGSRVKGQNTFWMTVHPSQPPWTWAHSGTQWSDVSHIIKERQPGRAGIQEKQRQSSCGSLPEGL